MRARRKVQVVCPKCEQEREVQYYHTLKESFTGMCVSCSRSSRRGEDHPLWKGGSTITAQGYRKVKADDHPARDKDGYVFEHRLVMEDKIGRFLHRDETVHHKDGDRLNNDSSNLELWTGNHGKGIRHQSFIVQEDLEWMEVW